MLKLVLILLVMVPGVVFADTELSQDEILGVLKILTAKKTQGWITSGVISADHVEFRAPKIDDPNEIEIEVVKAVKEHKEKGKTGNELEAVHFNTRYRLGNSFNMVSKEFVRVDGDKFYWQIEIDSRKDSIKPSQIEKANYSIKYFLMNWNQLRIFAWDGEKHTTYYRPGNYAIITDDQSNVNGPLTAGCISWGQGKWSYEELEKCQLNASRTENDEFILNISNDLFTKEIILDELEDYTVKSYEREDKLSGIVTSYIFGDYKKFSDGWVPTSIMKLQNNSQKVALRDVWTNITVDEVELSEDDFAVNFDYNAFIEDFRFGSDPLQFRYEPVMELEAGNVDVQDIYADKIEYLASASGLKSNCALASIWYACKKMNREISVKEIGCKVPIKDGQSSLSDMEKMINSIDGLNAVSVNADILDIAQLKNSQAILYFPEKKHFVNLFAVDSENIYIADIDSKKFSYKISRSSQGRDRQGIALLILDSNITLGSEFARLTDKKRVTTYGAANCSICGEFQAASVTGSCSENGTICSGDIIETCYRMKCIDGSNGNCNNDKTLPFTKTKTCYSDINDDCTTDGAKEVVQQGLACG